MIDAPDTAYDRYHERRMHHRCRRADALERETQQDLTEMAEAEAVAGRCVICGGAVERVRCDEHPHLVVSHYCCVAECRGGGHRVHDRAGDEIRTAGPIFDRGGEADA